MYIHNIYNNMQISDFGEEKIQQQAMVAWNQIRSLNMKFKAELEKKTQGTIEYQKLLEELESKIQMAADKSMQELQQISGTAVREAIDKAIATQNSGQDMTAAINEVNTQIQNLKNSFLSFESSYQKARAALPTSALGEAYSSNKVALDQAYKVIQAALSNPSFKRLCTSGWGSSSNDTSLMSLRGFISQIIQHGMLFGEAKTGPATAIGFLAEGVFGNAMNDILSSFELANGFSLRASATGAQSGYANWQGKQVGFKAKTSDISLELVDKHGQFVMQLPGISLKRTGAYDRNNVGDMLADIHVKTSNLGNMLNTARIQNIQQEHIYNLMANNGRAAKVILDNDGTIGETYQHPTVNLNGMYRWIYAATLLASFAGNLTMSDFANFWVVNDKVYTAPEIIAAAFSGRMPAGDKGRKVFLKYLDDASKSGIASFAANIPQQHSAIFDQLLATSRAPMVAQGEQRSQKILNTMQGIKYSMYLRVNINALLGY